MTKASPEHAPHSSLQANSSRTRVARVPPNSLQRHPPGIQCRSENQSLFCFHELLLFRRKLSLDNDDMVIDKLFHQYNRG